MIAICSIGSGAIESTVKQIDCRTKISGAQWKIENVPQVIAHRCAYLNGLIFAPRIPSPSGRGSVSNISC